MEENNVYPIDLFDYDLENDSLLFNYKGIDYKTSIRIDNIILDLGVDGSPVGAEILNASKIFKVPKIALKNPKNFYAEISISKESIEMKFTISVVVRNHKTEKFASSHSINDVNIPSAQIAMVESFA
jgi:uncharacterized protein YuzE